MPSGKFTIVHGWPTSELDGSVLPGYQLVELTVTVPDNQTAYPGKLSSICIKFESFLARNPYDIY